MCIWEILIDISAIIVAIMAPNAPTNNNILINAFTVAPIKKDIIYSLSLPIGNKY